MEATLGKVRPLTYKTRHKLLGRRLKLSQ